VCTLPASLPLSRPGACLNHAAVVVVAEGWSGGGGTSDAPIGLPPAAVCMLPVWFVASGKISRRVAVARRGPTLCLAMCSAYLESTL